MYGAVDARWRRNWICNDGAGVKWSEPLAVRRDRREEQPLLALGGAVLHDDETALLLRPFAFAALLAAFFAPRGALTAARPALASGARLAAPGIGSLLRLHHDHLVG